MFLMTGDWLPASWGQPGSSGSRLAGAQAMAYIRHVQRPSASVQPSQANSSRLAICMYRDICARVCLSWQIKAEKQQSQDPKVLRSWQVLLG